MKFLILIFILAINSTILKPSDDIWDKVLKYINEGKMDNFNKMHFFFDEDNITALDINDTKKMKDLYEKQREICYIYGVSTYIFSVKYINESIEEIGSIRNNTRDNLRKGGYYVDNSIFAIFSIESVSGKIYTGKYINNVWINDSEASSIKENLTNSLKNKSYYNAWNNFLDDIKNTFLSKLFGDFIEFENITFNESNSSPSPSPSPYPRKPSSSSLNVMAILGPIIGGGIVIVICFFLIKCCLSWKPNSNNDNNNSTDYNYNYNNNYSYNNNNNSYDNHSRPSIGGNSIGGNSVGGNSIQVNNAPSFGGNSLHSGGA